LTTATGTLARSVPEPFFAGLTVTFTFALDIQDLFCLFPVYLRHLDLLRLDEVRVASEHAKNYKGIHNFSQLGVKMHNPP
jgi:hypothetical protein